MYAETEHMHFYHKDKKYIHRIGKIFIVLFGIFIIAHSQNFCKTKKLKTRYKLTNRPVFGRLVQTADKGKVSGQIFCKKPFQITRNMV